MFSQRLDLAVLRNLLNICQTKAGVSPISDNGPVQHFTNNYTFSQFYTKGIVMTDAVDKGRGNKHTK